MHEVGRCTGAERGVAVRGAGVVVDLLFSPDTQMGKNGFDVSL